ncbi:a-factor receptor [Onygenales sp. PD_12]|nr:a-factor receptor [Onygenales sp. PD_12]
MGQLEPLYSRSPAAVALPIIAFLSVLVCVPPLIWHSRTGNLPAACLISWFIIFNFFNFINPLIWPTDDVASWWDGVGLCDVETKLIAPLGTGIAGTLVCIFRALADVMNTERTALIPSKAQRRLTVIYRLFKYRRQFSYIISISSKTSKSRFIRLMALSLIILLGSLPTQLYVFYSNVKLSLPWVPYSWKEVHGPEWAVIEKVPMGGVVFYDRWTQVTCGFLLFIFFGFGKDATMMYRTFLLRIGLGRFFPSLYHPHIDTNKGSTYTGSGSFSRRKMSTTNNSSSGGDSPLPWSLRSNSVCTETTNGIFCSRQFSVSSLNKPLPAAPRPPSALHRILNIFPVPEGEANDEKNAEHTPTSETLVESPAQARTRRSFDDLYHSTIRDV